MSGKTNICNIFSDFQQYLEDEQQLREVNIYSIYINRSFYQYALMELIFLKFAS